MAPAPRDYRLETPHGRACRFGEYDVEAVLAPGDRHKARVMLARRGEQRCVIKDLSRMRPLFRWFYGRRMLAREARALDRLAGFESVPRLVERLSKDALVTEFIPAIYLRKSLPVRRKPAVLRAFRDVVSQLHERGVVHLDLRQRKNVLVLPDDRVVLIDFESALVLGDRGVRGWLRDRLAPIDRSAVLKWRAKYTPNSLTRDERKALERHRRWQRVWVLKDIGRFLRGLFARRVAA
jgi:RIO-like serine/threonine protein kinase